MRSKVAKRILDQTPQDLSLFVSWCAAIAVRINHSIKEKNITQKSLAENLGKQPSEIHRWINEEHNFTLRSLAKLQIELGETLIEIPEKPKVYFSADTYKQVTLTVYRQKISPKKKSSGKSIFIPAKIKNSDYANVG